MLLPIQVVDQYASQLFQVATSVAIFVIAFIALYYLGRSILVRLTRRSLEARDFKPGIISIATSVVAIIALIGAFSIAATLVGYGSFLVAFTTLSGALALAVGFAAQDMIANFVAGIFILKDEPFRTGDWIEWNGNVGVVREIQLRITKLDSFDNELVTVPNNELANAVVTNPVANEQLRISYRFGIGYDDDIEAAQSIITTVGSDLDGVLADPAPTAPISDLGDSAVVLEGRLWIDPGETGAGGVKAAFVKRVKERFDAEGIDMPYPHTQVTGDIDVTGAPAVT